MASGSDNATGSTVAANPGILLVSLLATLFLALINPLTAAAMYPGLRELPPLAGVALVALYTALALSALAGVWKWRRASRAWAARLVFERVPMLGGVALSMLTLLVLLAVVEMACWRLAERRPPAQGFRNEFDPGSLVRDPVLGWRGRLNKVDNHKVYLTPENELLFDKRYTFGPDRYRVVPAPAGPKSSHLVFFGCSYTFGVGANDDETLPAYAAALRPEVQVYSFALMSYGPAQALLLAREGVLDTITEPAGAGVFLLIPDHLNRLHPKMSYLDWMWDFPAFELDEAGRTRHLGPMSSVYRWQQWGMLLLSKSQFKRWARIELPTKIPPEAFPLCAALLAELREAYRAKFPGNEFYVILDPLWYPHHDRLAMLLELEKRGLPLLSAKGALGEHPAALHYPRDFHPMPEANRKIAEWLWEAGLPPLK